MQFLIPAPKGIQAKDDLEAEASSVKRSGLKTLGFGNILASRCKSYREIMTSQPFGIIRPLSAKFKIYIFFTIYRQIRVLRSCLC